MCITETVRGWLVGWLSTAAYIILALLANNNDNPSQQTLFHQLVSAAIGILSVVETFFELQLQVYIQSSTLHLVLESLFFDEESINRWSFLSVLLAGSFWSNKNNKKQPRAHFRKRIPASEQQQGNGGVRIPSGRSIVLTRAAIAFDSTRLLIAGAFQTVENVEEEP